MPGRLTTRVAAHPARSPYCCRVSRAEAATRGALAVTALILVAWFAVLVANDREGSAAKDRISLNPDMSAGDWTRAIGDLEAAAELKPGQDWNIARANYLLLRDKRAARRVAEAIVREEPDSVDGWSVVLRATRESDPARSAQAEREIQRLVSSEN